MRPCAVAALLVLTSAVASCGPPPCASSAACADGLVCGLDGRCGPLSAVSESRFAGSRWLTARDWATSTPDGVRTDTLLLGGPNDAEAWLAFGPLPAQSRIRRALLVLHPHDPLARIDMPGELVVERAGQVRGGRLPARHIPAPIALAVARGALPSGPARPVRVDVTQVAREAASRSGRMLYVIVRLTAGPAGGARFASPWALEHGTHPRLEMMLH